MADTADHRYLQVARALRKEIVDGVYPVGSQLPTEHQLCERFSVSRYTVREALSRPEELRKVVGGLIERGEVDAGSVDAADPLGFLGDGRAVVEAAYRFCRHELGAHVVLTGTGDPEHLKANVAAIQQPPLSPEVMARLDAIFGRVDSVSGN